MRCLIICACEKVIVDKTNGANSLISLLRTANVQITNAAAPAMPSNAVVPSLWYVYTMWESEPEDTGLQFDQVTEIYWPNGELFISNRLPFKAEKSLIVQNANGFVGFPAGQIGKIKITAWIEHNTKRASETAHYEVAVVHDEPSFGNPVTAPPS